MGEVSREMIKKREEQLSGLKRLWERLLTEYFEQKGEYPPLKSSDPAESNRRVQQFIGSRSEIVRAIAGLDMVQDAVTMVALEVLADLENEK